MRVYLIPWEIFWFNLFVWVSTGCPLLLVVRYFVNLMQLKIKYKDLFILVKDKGHGMKESLWYRLDVIVFKSDTTYISM